jgi:hypothetical protein
MCFSKQGIQDESKNDQENRSNSIIRVNDGLVQTAILAVINHLRVKKMLSSLVTRKKEKKTYRVVTRRARHDFVPSRNGPNVSEYDFCEKKGPTSVVCIAVGSIIL